MVASNPDSPQDAKPNQTPEDHEEEEYTICPSNMRLLDFAGHAVGQAAFGAFMGSICGFGSGLMRRKGFKELLGEGGSSAKGFAILAGVHSLVSCSLNKLRGKDDAINAGVAGCIAGLALNVPGSPQALLQGCVTFGALSFIFEEFDKSQVAVALPLSSSREQAQDSLPQIPFPILPPFTLPPFVKGISALYQSKLHTSSRNHKL